MNAIDQRENTLLGVEVEARMIRDMLLMGRGVRDLSAWHLLKASEAADRLATLLRKAAKEVS